MSMEVVKKGMVWLMTLLFIAYSLTAAAEEPTKCGQGGNKTHLFIEGVHRIWYVDDEPGGDPPEDYTSIQDAINNASPGDIIYVYNGTYRENIIIDRSIELLGESKSGTVIDARNISYGASIRSSNVRLKGFTITNGSSESGGMVIIYEKKEKRIRYISIEDCAITGNKGYGVKIVGKFQKPKGANRASVPSIDGVIVSHCKITVNGGGGVYSKSANIERITYCNISGNDGDGIHIEQSPVTIIMENLVMNNNGHGLFLKGDPAAWLGIFFVQENHIAENDETGLTLETYVFTGFVSRNNFIGNHGKYQMVADLWLPPLPLFIRNNYWKPYTISTKLFRILPLRGDRNPRLSNPWDIPEVDDP
ncbi:MAG TPA: hypothetical protein ENI45_00095 [Thermoplasmatales archaeon]|nr:hypothetical protein [Thermoplasmatales archaeon]